MGELYLIARIAERTVVLPTDRIDSVVDIADVVPVPCADPCVRGLAALRSRVVTVIDTGVALGLGPLNGRRAAIARVDGHLYAFLVDALNDVERFEAQPVVSGMATAASWSDAGIGLVERDGEPLLILDPAALVPTAAQAA